MITDDFITQLNSSFDNDGRILISKFFIVFSRFEYALKSANHRNGANPNWDSFASSINGNFDKERSEELKEAVEYIVNNPPKVQGEFDGKLIWKDREFHDNTPLTLRLSLSIRDIRNNLFHGGKFQGTFQPEISRNYRLLEKSIIILNEWLGMDRQVREKFTEPILY